VKGDEEVDFSFARDGISDQFSCDGDWMQSQRGTEASS
jgi:hypothetical protein